MQLSLVLRVVTDKGSREIHDLAEMERVLSQVRSFANSFSAIHGPESEENAEPVESAPSPSPRQEVRKEPKVPSRAKLLTYLGEHLDEPIRLTEAAKHFGVQLEGTSRSNYNTMWRNFREAQQIVAEQKRGEWVQTVITEGSTRIKEWRFVRKHESLLPRPVSEAQRVVAPLR